jgi:hypothetical protein
MTPTVLNLGGGIQSSYMLLKACRNEMPRPSHVVFADTGWEPPSVMVMAQIQWLIEEAAKHGIRVDTVRYKINIKENLRIAAAGGHFDTLPMYTRPKVTAWEDATDAATFIGLSEAIMKYIRRTVLGLRPHQKRPEGVTVEQWLGISTDETLRATRAKTRDKWITIRYPLIEAGVSRTMCQEWLAKEYPQRKWLKSACSGCPFRSDDSWRWLKENEPAEFQEVVELEREMTKGKVKGLTGTPYFHRTRKPLDEVFADPNNPPPATAYEKTNDGFGNDCTGHCSI